MDDQRRANWYPDPVTPDQVRYWNGMAWTSHTQSAPVAGLPTEGLVAPATSTTTGPPHGRVKGPSWWGVLAGALVLLVVGLIATNGFLGSKEADERAAVVDSINEDGSAELQSLTTAWNELSGEIVNGYLDPSMPREYWVTSATPVLAELRQTYLEMEAAAMLGKSTDARLADFLDPMMQTYREKLNGIQALIVAVSRADTTGEREALAQLDRAGVDAMDLAQQAYDELMRSGSPEELEQWRQSFE